MVNEIETVLKNARVDYHMWQSDSDTYEILLMSRSGKGIVDVKLSRDKNNRWRIGSEVAEWLVAEIQNVLGARHDESSPRVASATKKRARKKATTSKKPTKASTSTSRKGSSKPKPSRSAPPRKAKSRRVGRPESE